MFLPCMWGGGGWGHSRDSELLKKYSEINQSRSVIQMVVYILLPPKKRAYLCKSIAIKNGSCITILFKSVVVRG